MVRQDLQDQNQTTESAAEDGSCDVTTSCYPHPAELLLDRNQLGLEIKREENKNIKNNSGSGVGLLIFY